MKKPERIQTVSKKSKVPTFIFILITWTIINLTVLLVMNIIQLKQLHEMKQTTPEVVTAVVEEEVKMEVEKPIPVSQCVSVQENLITLNLPVGVTGKFKTYMDYRTITSKSSKQWNLQQLCETNELGFRKFNDKYVVAVGTYYAKQVGKEIVVTLKGGKSIHCIVGDIKMDIHTDENNQYIPFNGNIVEFIIDKEVMDELPLKLGDVSSLGLEGEIISIMEVRICSEQ